MKSWQLFVILASVYIAPHVPHKAARWLTAFFLVMALVYILFGLR